MYVYSVGSNPIEQFEDTYVSVGREKKGEDWPARNLYGGINARRSV